MKKLLLILVLLINTNNIYAVEKTLSCVGSVKIVGVINDKFDKDINFSFDDVKQTYSADGMLFCLDKKLKTKQNYFNKDEIFTSSYTEGTEIGDIGHCESSLSLNRNTGKLTYSKTENNSGSIVLSQGSFKCELAKQKF